MNKPRIAALAAALALGSTPLLAASGDAWYGTNRHAWTGDPVEVTRAETPGVIAYEERTVTRPVIVEPVHAPVIVEREVLVTEPRDVVIVGYTDVRPAAYDPLFPERGPWIDHGLFNKNGPNDFGQ